MAQTIRLCTWNIQLGLQLPEVIQALQTRPEFAGLDLLALQEASVHSGVEDAQVVATVLGSEYNYFQVTAHYLGNYAQANALVWNTKRVRIDGKDTVNLPGIREVSLSRIERTFLGAFRQQQRISVVLDGSIGGQSLRVYVAHLDVLGVAHKREQFHRILADARTRQPPTDLTVLAGDLNTFRIRSRPTWGGLTSAAEREGFYDLTSEIEWTHHTWRRFQFHQKLDAIFVRPGSKMQYRSSSLDIPGSDHIPVFGEITFEN